MTQVKHQITIQEFTRKKVIALLDVSELEYGQYQMAQGMAYLADQLGSNLLGRKLAANALYWKWWRNHWHDTDMEWLESIAFMNAAERRTWYELLHDPKDFEYKPQRAILQDALNNINNPEVIKHTL